jgi:hypothetical protein
MTKNPDKNWSFLICLTLTLVTLAVYFQVHSFNFVNYDDDIYVYKNPHVLNGLTADNIK